MPSLNHKIAGTGSPMAIHGNVIGCLSMVSREVGKLLISVGGTAIKIKCYKQLNILLLHQLYQR